MKRIHVSILAGTLLLKLQLNYNGKNSTSKKCTFNSQKIYSVAYLGRLANMMAFWVGHDMGEKKSRFHFGWNVVVGE